MSLASRREYLQVMRKRYCTAVSRQEKGQILDEVCATCCYHRKYAIRVLTDVRDTPRPRQHRVRRSRYLEALSVVQTVWEALDYPCAERLQPVLLQVAEHLNSCGELGLTPLVREQLAHISRATLARRIAHFPSPKARRLLSPSKRGLRRGADVPIGRYEWDEDRPGALEIDLVEHNGGHSSGHFAYTLSVVDVVTGWSRRKAVLGRGQRGVHEALSAMLAEWPYPVWGLHSDNGAEFLNDQIKRLAKEKSLHFTRSRPYRKNDNAHVEQRNRQFVREIVGYDRYDTPEQITWLNQVYAILDPYANLFLPTRKVVAKERKGARLRKRYDVARTPYTRTVEKKVIPYALQQQLDGWIASHSPLVLHRRLQRLLADGAPALVIDDAAD
jgi:hypothetical protein